MHPEAYLAVRRMIWRSGINTQERWTALDIGGAYWNGSARPELPDADWTVLDQEDPFADNMPPTGFMHGWNQYVVGDATTWQPTTLYDVVLCTEVFEHVENWRAIVRTIWSAINPKSPAGIVIITCASTGRSEHGATGEPTPAKGEWYANVPAPELQEELYRYFTSVDVEYAPTPGDVYALATGPKLLVELESGL
jgi:hypothetical protein